MKRLFCLITILVYFSAFPISAQEKEHKHPTKEKGSPQTQHDAEEDHEGDEHEHGEDKHGGHDQSEDSHGHGEADGHEEHGEHEESAQVGPGKGILEASESEGIKLSPEAEKNFELARIKVSGGGIEIPKRAIVRAVAEVNVYRYRNGFYKRVDFAEVNRSADKIAIRSREIKPGDEIAIQGLGFLRLAEIAAFGGAPEGHSH